MIFKLRKELTFPPASLAEPEGLLAVGGDLSVKRLMLAYKSGIFPWYSEGEPILWWSPDPRFVLYPEKLKVSKSLERVIRSGRFEVTLNRDFRTVMSNCGSAKRRGESDTWITSEMIDAYCRLNEKGHAWSVEVWEKGELVGGLYGVKYGCIFSGESMFAKVSNASKVGLVFLVRHLQAVGCKVIDCQVVTEHLRSLGAEEISRDEYLDIVCCYSG